MDLVLVISLAVHTLSIVVVLGYYGVLGLMVLPGLRRTLDPRAVAQALVAIQRRARPLLVLAIAGFAITGIYLTFGDEQYQGLVQIGSSGWTTLILGKHLVVAVLVGLGLLVDRMIDGLAEWREGPPASLVRRVGLAADSIAALGAVVILMTAAAQLAPS